MYLTRIAASGDLRNVIQSIIGLSQTYKGSVSTVVNDIAFDVVARSIIVLLVGLIVEDDVKAVQCMLHVWYSSTFRQADADILSERVSPLYRM